MSRSPALAALLLSFLSSCSCSKKPDAAPAAPDAGPPPPHLASVGPRLLSNQTSQPLSVQGERLTQGLKLKLGPPVNQGFPLTVLDERHAFTRLPAHLPLGYLSELSLSVSLESPGGPAPTGAARLTFANDTTFPDLVGLALSPKGTHAAAASPTEDLLYVVNLSTREVVKVGVDDGPSAVSAWVDGAGREWWVVVHQFAPVLFLVSVDGDGKEQVSVPAPANASGVVVSKDGVAFVAEQARDTVAALSLTQKREVWRTPVAPNPRELSLTPAGLAVGSQQAGLVEWLDEKTGAPRSAVQPGPGVSIVGGGTERYGKYVMGGKAVRGLAFSERLKALFVSSIGPNVGPNPDKLEVSMNGGVGVVDPASGWKRHLGFGAGVTLALALDDAQGLLYGTDVSLGLVRVLDAKKLARSDDGARAALLQEVALPVPEGFPLVRREADFNVNGRAGPSLHSGPTAAVLSPDKKALYVLNRFTGALAVLDVSKAAQKKAVWKEQVRLASVLGQQQRRLGQVLYFADLGRTGMSCDACHLEGHGEGIFFEKTTPMRVYRSTTLRGSRETPPYFTPASTRSLGETVDFVGARNRFHNPDPSAQEVDALALYTSLIPTLPNPFVGEDGAPKEALTLPDGATGNPRRGLVLFEGKAGCAQCHPAPHFTTDQDAATRGKYLDVGTPHLLPLREHQQDDTFLGFAPPALVGAWDVFPMLTTGLAGLTVRPDESVALATRFPLRVAVEAWAPSHGRADLLTPEERNDLLAWLMSL
ncbi:MAG: MtsA protein [Myxococcales bacterium]|nr:MtsA protein [Myxococcales bacterium]